MLQVQRPCSSDPSLVLLKRGRAKRDCLLPLLQAGLANLLGELGRLGTDEPRLLALKEEVKVFERLAGGLDDCESEGGSVSRVSKSSQS